MTPYLSIIIASHNDADQTALTLASIRETTPASEAVEVIVVDDCSATGLHHYIKEGKDCTALIQNQHRCGCGASRHIGALRSAGNWLLIVDSHMRFTKGWFEEFCNIVYPPACFGMPRQYYRQTVFCATCLGLDSKHMDVNNPVSEYHGATMNFLGPDRNKADAPEQVFEAVWLPKDPEPQDLQEIPAIMGACYFISREWFLNLAPTRFLKTWGCDEQMISLKSWLAGGSVRLAKKVRIGHKFLAAGERQTWGCPLGHVTWNKLFAINTLLPVELAIKLSARALAGASRQDAEAAARLYRQDYALVAQEKAFNASIFQVMLADYAEKFSIQLPF